MSESWKDIVWDVRKYSTAALIYLGVTATHEVNASYDLRSFAWGDPGTESGHTIGPINEHIVLQAGADRDKFLRHEVEQTDASADLLRNQSWRLQYRLRSNGAWGSWTTMPTTASTNPCHIRDDTNITQGGDTTNRMTGGSTPYNASTLAYITTGADANGIADTSSDTGVCVFTQNATTHVETLHSIRFNNANLSPGDVLEFRIVHGAGGDTAADTLLTTYHPWEARVYWQPADESFSDDFDCITDHTRQRITGTTATVLGGMTSTPASGDYLVIFNAEFSPPGHTTEELQYAIYVAGTEQADSRRRKEDNPTYGDPADSQAGMSESFVSACTQCVVTVNGSQAIDVRAKSSSTVAPWKFDRRSLIIVPLPDSAKYSEKVSTTLATTSSTDFSVLLTGMTVVEGTDISGGAGDYLVLFTGNFRADAGAAAETTPSVQLYVGGTAVAHTRREARQEASWDNDYNLLTIAAVVTIAATDDIDVRWANTGVAGTIECLERNLVVYGPLTSGTDYYQDSGTDSTPDSDSGQAFVAIDDDAGADLSVSPSTDDYIGMFTGWGDITTVGNSDDWGLGFASAGTVQYRTMLKHQLEESMADAGEIAVALAGRVNVGASEAVTIQWRGTTGDTRNMRGRTMLLWKPLAGAGQTITGTVASAAFAAIAPSITLGALTVTSPVAAAAWSGVAPNINLGAVQVNPTPAAAAWAGITPGITLGARQVNPAGVDAVFAGATPGINLGALNITAPVAIAAWGVFTPGITSSLAINAPSSTAAWAAVAPGFNFGVLQINSPAVDAVFAGVTPGINLGPLTVSSPVAVAAWAGVTPADIAQFVGINPATVAAAWSALAPAVNLGALQIAPTGLDAVWSALAPAVNLGARQINPAGVAGAWSALAPALNLGPLLVNPTPASAAFTVVVPGISLGAFQISPASVDATWGAFTPVVQSGADQVTAVPVDATWGVFTPASITGGEAGGVVYVTTGRLARVHRWHRALWWAAPVVGAGTELGGML